MQRIWGICKKEWRSYFNSPIAYIVITVLLIGIGYFFFQTFFVANQVSLRTFFRAAAWSFLLFGPAITMKLFAEEKKVGTIETLLTLPMKEWEVVLGKFLAAWALLAAYLLITLAYPITLSFIGDLDKGPVIGGYFGLFLLGGTLLALGLFASSITKNQVVSLIVSVTIGLVLFLLDSLLPFMPEWMQNTMEFVGIDSHFQNIARGMIDTRDVVYSISLMIFLLFVTVQVLEARLTDRSGVRKLNKVLYIGGAIGCLISLNALSFNLFSRFDLTQDRMFTLSDASKDLVKELKDQLTIKAFFSKNLPAPFNNYERYLKDQLQEYRNYSNGKLNFVFVDPDKKGKDNQPDKGVMSEIQAGRIVKVEVNKLEKDQLQVVNVYMGLTLNYQDKMESIPVLRSINDLEYELTSRLRKLTQPKTPKLGFLTGHDELTPTQGLKNAMQLLGDKYQVAEINLEKDDSALKDMDLMVVAGSKKEIPAYQRFWIDQFIMKGGKVAFFLDRSILDMKSFIGRPFKSGLEDLCAAYGVIIEPSMLLDEMNQKVTVVRAQGNVRFNSVVPFPPVIRVQDIAKDSPLVKNLRDLTLPFASPLTVKPVKGVEYTVIARSSPRTWLFENNDSFLLEPQSLPVPEEKDFVGPQNMVVTLTGSLHSYFTDHEIPPKEEGTEPITSTLDEKSPDTRLVVIGASAWLSDAMQNPLGYVFFANLVDWLSQDERLINIRTRGIINRPLANISEPTKNVIRYGNMFALPLAFVAYGVVRWRLRLRKKRKGLY